jgi:hypothetical protein
MAYEAMFATSCHVCFDAVKVDFPRLLNRSFLVVLDARGTEG